MSSERRRFLGTEPITSTLKPAVVIGGELYFGFGVTRQFLKRAVAEGADQVWTRDVEIVRRYIETPDTLEDIGRAYDGLTRERIRQIVFKGVRNLWRNCSPQTQRLFPINEIPLHKPRPQPRRERISGAGEGLELPYLVTPPQQKRELDSKLANPNLSDLKIQKLLDQVYRKFLDRDRSQEQPLLIPVK